MSRSEMQPCLERNPHLRPAERLYLDRLLRHLTRYFPAGTQVLDAGCGDGKLAEVLADMGCQVTAVDVEPHRAAWERLAAKGLTCREGSAEALPFKDGTFDAVLVKDAFHHMQDPVRALGELQRVTRAGGPVVVIEANRYNPVFYLHMTLMEGHQHFSRKALKRFLREADPQFSYRMAESRCLPWDAPWLLTLLDGFETLLERLRIFEPWLTYQLAVVRGLGRRR